jgi:hypothetical protein
MKRYEFASDTNQRVFTDTLEYGKVPYGVAGYVVTVHDATDWVDQHAQDLGGTVLPERDDGHSTTGVDPFLDIHATAQRAVAETPYRDVSNQIDSQKPQLKSVKTKRRKTRSQP